MHHLLNCPASFSCAGAKKKRQIPQQLHPWPVSFRKNLPRLQPAGSPWWAQEAAAAGSEVALKWSLHSCPIPQRVHSSLSWGRPSCRLRKHKDHQSWIKALRGQRKLWTDSSLTQSWPFVVHSGLTEPGQIPNRLYETVKHGSVKRCKLRHLVTTSACALTSVQPSESHQFPLSCGHPRLNHSPRFCTAIIRVTSLKWRSRTYQDTWGFENYIWRLIGGGRHNLIPTKIVVAVQGNFDHSCRRMFNVIAALCPPMCWRATDPQAGEMS